MCAPRDIVRIHKCSHGTFHLTVRDTTLHLNAEEMSAETDVVLQVVERETGTPQPDTARREPFRNN